MSGGSTVPIRLLAKARALLELLAEESPLPPATLASRLSMPRASVYRLVEGLTAVGLTRVDGEAGVELGLRWLHLADAARDGVLADWGPVRDRLARVAESTGLTAYFSVLREHRAFCVEWAPGGGLGALELHPGGALELNLGGAGRALLAFAPGGAERMLETIEPRVSTRHSLVDREALLRDVQATRERGHALSLDDVTLGVGAVGVPVLDAGGDAVAVLSAAGLSEDVLDRQPQIAAALVEAATSIAP